MKVEGLMNLKVKIEQVIFLNNIKFDELLFTNNVQ